MRNEKLSASATFHVHERFIIRLIDCEFAEDDSARREDNSMKKLIISLVALSAVATMATTASARPWHHHWHHHYHPHHHGHW